MATPRQQVELPAFPRSRPESETKQLRRELRRVGFVQWLLLLIQLSTLLLTMGTFQDAPADTSERSGQRVKQHTSHQSAAMSPIRYQ